MRSSKAKKDGVHSKSVVISAKGSRVKRSQNNDAVSKDDTNHMLKRVTAALWNLP